MIFNDRRVIRSVDNTAEYRARRAADAASKGGGPVPSVKSLDDKYGAKLPRGLKPRTSAEWNARASVISAARAGSIKKMPKKGN